MHVENYQSSDIFTYKFKFAEVSFLKMYFGIFCHPRQEQHGAHGVQGKILHAYVAGKLHSKLN